MRVDHGTEFALIATAQHLLSTYRHNQSRQPILQSLSRQNHRAERIWPEINQRINYPIKRILIDMENNDEINMGEEVTKFCVSCVTIQVMDSGIKYFIEAWNSHRIPGLHGGVPNILSLHSNATALSPHFVPSTEQIIALHESDGHRLTRSAVYGYDPLHDHPELQALRERDFLAYYPEMKHVFESILHSDGEMFKNCIKQFLRLTNSFSQLLD